MTISAIIATRKIDADTLLAINELEKMSAVSEIVVLPDGEVGAKPGLAFVPNDKKKTLIFTTGPISPGAKRNIGAGIAIGDVFGFLDGDVVPEAWWADCAVQGLDKNPDVASIGGPAITFWDASFWERVSGEVFSCWLVSGAHIRRYVPTKSSYVDDWPSCNLLVWRADFERAGGFPANTWPGEDSLFCNSLLQYGKILYSPDVPVWHRRRKTLCGHIAQVWGYGWHRGWFFRKYGGNSRRIAYCLPSLLVLSLGAGWALSPAVWTWGLVLYAGAVCGAAMGCLSVSLYPAVVLGIVATHCTYGIGFLRGLVKK